MNQILMITIGILAVSAVAYLANRLFHRRQQVKTVPALAPQTEPAAETALPDDASDTSILHKTDKDIPVPSVAQHRQVSIFSGIPSFDAAAGDSITENQSRSLDKLLKIAYCEKEKGNDALALEAFIQALRLFPESASAPYMVIEIGTLLKNQGAYDEAINLFSEGRNLPATIQNPILDQEFVYNIAYLRIAKNILLKRTLGLVPACQIPGDVLAEIDHEFAEWSVVE